MKYSVDRFEGDYAVLIDGEGNPVPVELSCLSENAKPGSVVRKEENKYVVDDEETAARKKRLLGLQNSLFSE